MYSRELNTFIVVIEQGSFLKASKVLFTTPASVMNQVNKFESRIGAKLIERTNQGVKLTSQGRVIYKEAKKIVKISKQAVLKAKQISVNKKQVIRVGTSILRPCKMLVDLWSKIDDGTSSITVHIVPFDDTPFGMETMLSSLGETIDCFAGPCDSLTWKENYNILQIKQGNCAIAVPRKHRLSKKNKLCWNDLNGETIILVKQGDSPVLNSLRNEINTKHPKITILDSPHFYDTSIFNECEQMGCIMETLDIWKDVHPSIVTIPMEWDYKIPYGIIYAKHPSKTVDLFISKIKDSLEK